MIRGMDKSVSHLNKEKILATEQLAVAMVGVAKTVTLPGVE